MPQIASRRPTKRSGRSRRAPARRSVPRPIVSLRNDRRNYKFVKFVDKGILTSSSVAEGLYGFQFYAGDLSEISSFTSIFDQYRITAVHIVIKPSAQLSTTASATPPYAYLYVVTDYDDSSTLASASLALNYQNCSIITPGYSHSRVVRPHVNLTAASGGSGIAVSRVSPWVDAADTNVIHYGLKCAVTQSTSTNLAQWHIWFRYFVEFRMVR
jgi:hypothetical protein